MIVERFKIQGAVDVDITVAGDGITKTCSILKFCTTNPCISGSVGCIGIKPIKDRQLVEWQLIRCRYLLLIVKRCTPVTDALLHRILPRCILVGIEVLIDRRIRLFYLSSGSRLEAEVKILGKVPSQREITIPQELR